MDVSVIVPAFNESKHIGQCLKSLREQDYAGSFEIILADGNSSDGTRSLAKGLAGKIVVERRRSPAFERNAGAAKAKGKLLAFIDSDAIAPKNWLRELIDPFKDSRVACTHGNLFLGNASWLEDLICGTFFPAYFWLSNWLGFPSGAGSNMAVRRDSFSKELGFNTKLVTGEDIDLEKRLLRHGRSVFAPKSIVRVSRRRIDSWGYPRFIWFHSNNWLRINILNKPFKKYELVR
ncbi:MAG: glycosyltransferase [Candidatus Micrarchaeota archaeon]